MWFGHRPGVALAPSTSRGMLMGKLHRGWVVLGSVAALGSVQAADIYRWVDEQGRTHLSDVVPDRYRDSATCLFADVIVFKAR